MSDLEDLRTMCAAYVAAEQRVRALEDELQLAKDDFNRLRMEDIPELFAEHEMTELALRSGERIIIGQEFSCGITEANKPAAHRWLDEHDNGGLIKTVVAVAFGKDERDDATTLAERLQNEEGLIVTRKEAVHPSTLKAFVKEQMEAGNEVPADLFSVHPLTIAKLERQ